MWKISGATTDSGYTDVHKTSGVLTYGKDGLCAGPPTYYGEISCDARKPYECTYYLISDGINFDDYHDEIGLPLIQKTIDAVSCNQEGLVMWFNNNSSGNTAYTCVLSDNSIFDIKNVDECNHIIITSGETNGIHVGGQKFPTSNYIDSGYPKIDTGNHSSSNIKYTSGQTVTGHKIKYHTTSNTVPINFFSGGSGKSELVELYFPSHYNNYYEGANIVHIGASAFTSSYALSAITFGYTLKTIGDSAFKNCIALKEIDWSHYPCGYSYSSIITISGSAFYGCSMITTLDTPSVENIGDTAFYGCTSLSKVSQLTNIKTIGNSAFGSCSNLTSINIGSKITHIGSRAFIGCTSLSSVTVDKYVTSTSNVPTLDADAFPSQFRKDGGSYYIKVPRESVNYYTNHPSWGEYKITEI